MKQEIEWVEIVQRKESVLFASLITKEDNRRYCLLAGIDYAMRDYKYVDGSVSFSTRDMNALFGLFFNRLHTEDNFLGTFAADCYLQCDNLIAKATEIEALGTRLTREGVRLEGLFKEYAEEAFKLLPYLYSANVIEILLHQEISEQLKKLMEPDDIEKHLAALIIPSKENVIVSEMNSLLEVGALIQRSPGASTLFGSSAEEIEEALPEVSPNISELISAHVNEYAWLNIHSGYLGAFMSMREAIVRLKTLVRKDCTNELSRRAASQAQREGRFEQLVSDFAISGKLLQNINAARDFIDVRMQRINAYFIAHYKVKNLMDAMALKIGVKYEDLLCLTFDEILDCLITKSQPDLTEITKRKQGFALVMIDGTKTIYTGPALRELQLEAKCEDYSNLNSIEGTTACIGEVVGATKILFDINDLHLMEDGSIVVSPMTTPDLMPALEMASGIITDEGGILCHAAIVSRELGIPCVIGTKIATKVLSDNTTVSLVANESKGIVRLIEKSELPGTPWWPTAHKTFLM